MEEASGMGWFGAHRDLSLVPWTDTGGGQEPRRQTTPRVLFFRVHRSEGDLV